MLMKNAAWEISWVSGKPGLAHLKSHRVIDHHFGHGYVPCVSPKTCSFDG